MIIGIEKRIIVTFYQELQLNQAGSKQLLKSSKTPQERRRHLAVYLFKVVLTLLFCVAFVGVFSSLFGEDNAIAGVVSLLFVLVFRQAGLGVRPSHGVLSLLLIFGVLIVSPHLANLLPPFGSFLVHLLSLFFVICIGCHDVRMSNQSTIVLCYLLLYGYDVSGQTFAMRAIGLACTGLLTALIYYRNQRKSDCSIGLLQAIKEFHLSSPRSRWQLQLTLSVSTAMLFSTLLGLPRSMWVGFAVLSVTQFSTRDYLHRAKYRLAGMLGGSALFLIAYSLIPAQYHSLFGIFGGLCVGFSATYGWQTTFNCLGALTTAAGLMGAPKAIFYRLLNTAFGVAYAFLFRALFQKLLHRLHPADTNK